MVEVYTDGAKPYKGMDNSTVLTKIAEGCVAKLNA